MGIKLFLLLNKLQIIIRISDSKVIIHVIMYFQIKVRVFQQMIVFFSRKIVYFPQMIIYCQSISFTFSQDRYDPIVCCCSQVHLNLTTASKLSNFSKTFQLRSVVSDFARLFPTKTVTFLLQTFQLKTFQLLIFPLAVSNYTDPYMSMSKSTPRFSD